eukprot:m.568014 g.568014  ORF g.568014 m.568014 type:complete len:89 (+) comp22257_c0_seq26:125-391(+)
MGDEACISGAGSPSSDGGSASALLIVTPTLAATYTAFAFWQHHCLLKHDLCGGSQTLSTVARHVLSCSCVVAGFLVRQQIVHTAFALR